MRSFPWVEAWCTAAAWHGRCSSVARVNEFRYESIAGCMEVEGGDWRMPSALEVAGWGGLMVQHVVAGPHKAASELLQQQCVYV